MTDLVQRLRREWMATQAATPKQLWVMVEKAQWMECTALTREAADEIERQTEIIVTLRQELKEAKARNTLYLSRLQEYEAREQ